MSDSPSPRPRPFPAKLVILGSVLVLVVVAVVVPGLMRHAGESPAAARNESPLPAGQHDGLSSYVTPAENIGPKSRFVFEAEIPLGSGPSSVYWYAYPVASTAYLVNGVTVQLAAFEKRLVVMDPIRIDVKADSPGKIATMNAVFPDSAPGE